MNIILGGTGHVSSAATKWLLENGEPVTIVSHDPEKAAEWQSRGAVVRIADVEDVDALRMIFHEGRRAFLLNPPAPPSSDTDATELRTGNAIADALDGSGLEKVVLESTYGAQPGQRCGDLTTLYSLEQRLAAQQIPFGINRAAYYFSNWDASLETARKAGIVRTVLDADLTIPMVAPDDLGVAAARRLLEAGDTGIRYIEGPQRYTARDVASAFARALGQPVRVETVPRDDWIAEFQRLGFSRSAAESYARMTAVSIDGGYAMPDNPVRGDITLETYIAALVERGSAT